MTESVKLEPCPFCGGEAARHTIGSEEPNNAGGDVIVCTRCGASSHVEFGRKENLVSSWNQRHQPQEREAVLEVEHLRHVVDRDRYIVAAALGGIQKEIAGREWLLEGRGPYEWDDDDYRKEFGAALDNIRDALGPLELVAWDKSDCTTDPDRVESARQAAREMLTLPRKPKVMIAADLGLPCPACNALTTHAPAVSTDEIVAVLEPFGKRAETISCAWPDDATLLLREPDQLYGMPGLTVGDFRRAAAILSRLRGEGE